MIEYQCHACRKFVGLASDLREGCVRVICIHCRRAQVIFLGNPGGRPLPKGLRPTDKPC